MNANVNTQQVTWGGYAFEVCQKDGQWSSLSGIYIFTGSIQGAWRALYIGQTKSFAARPGGFHSEWAAAQRLGATHVHARVVHDQRDRDALEQTLIRQFQPPLNQHYR